MSAAVQLLEQLLAAARAAEAPPEPPPARLPLFETIDEFAERRRVSAKTVRRLITDGMPHERPRPRIIRIPVDRAETWIADRTRSESVEEAQRRAILDARKAAH